MSVLPVGFGGAKGYQIANSLRFRASASAYLNRTFGTPTSSTIWTWSGWVKRGALTGTYRLFGASTTTYLTFNSSDQLNLTLNGASAATSTAVFRDPSAHYHVVYQQNGSAQTIYVNNTSVATGTTAAAVFNTAIAHQLGAANTSNYFDGYLSEVNFIDGQALTPTSFGQTNADGVWVPKKYTGTYGNNGFYLKFDDGSSATTLCYDRSGNGNNWTPNNISTTAGVTYDWMADTPTNNYATLNNIAMYGSNMLIQYANLTSYATSTAVNRGWPSTIAAPGSGKWYAEFTFTSTLADNNGGCGIMLESGTSSPGELANTVRWADAANLRQNAAGSSYGTALSVNDVVMVAYDAGAGKVWFGKQGTWFASGNPATDTSPSATGITSTGRFASYHYSTNATISTNFGQRPFTYTPPTGFKALCTANMPAVAIAKPSDHHQVKLDTGANIKGVMDALFSGNLLEWIKDRGNANNHQLADVNRGLTAILQSNTTAAETTYSAPSGSSVGWGWKAGGTPVTNNAGSISSQVSANTTAGFSVVTYTGTNASSATVGHGLGIAPKFFILKQRNGSTYNWLAYHASVGAGSYLTFSGTAGATADTTMWSNTSPTSSVVTLSSAGNIAVTNPTGGTMLIYCFAEIPGYSKFGSYTGNGSADGPFVWCGFRPKYVLVKRTDSTSDWTIFDAARNTYNGMDLELYVDLNIAETAAGGIGIDFIAAGFKLRRTGGAVNASAATYIFAAFAEHPFGGSNVSPAPAR